MTTQQDRLVLLNNCDRGICVEEHCRKPLVSLRSDRHHVGNFHERCDECAAECKREVFERIEEIFYHFVAGAEEWHRNYTLLNDSQFEVLQRQLHKNVNAGYWFGVLLGADRSSPFYPSPLMLRNKHAVALFELVERSIEKKNDLLWFSRVVGPATLYPYAVLERWGLERGVCGQQAPQSATEMYDLWRSRFALVRLSDSSLGICILCDESIEFLHCAVSCNQCCAYFHVDCAHNALAKDSRCVRCGQDSEADYDGAFRYIKKDLVDMTYETLCENIEEARAKNKLAAKKRKRDK